MLSTGAVSKGAKREKLEKIVIDDDLEKFFQVGPQLPLREKEDDANLNRHALKPNKNIGILAQES